MNTTQDTRKDAHGFSITECSRCGGTGKHSFNQVDGDRCYGCNGSGMKHTPKAAKAYKAYRQALEASTASTASQVQAGDRVKIGAYNTNWKWMTVTTVEEDKLNAGCLTFVDTKGNRYGLAADCLVQNFTQATDAPNIADYAV